MRVGRPREMRGKVEGVSSAVGLSADGCFRLTASSGLSSATLCRATPLSSPPPQLCSGKGLRGANQQRAHSRAWPLTAAFCCYLAATSLPRGESAASSTAVKSAFAPVEGSKCWKSSSGPSNTKAPPCCRPCSSFGGSQGFHCEVAASKSDAPSCCNRFRTENDVSMVKIVCKPFLSPSAVYAAFSGSA